MKRKSRHLGVAFFKVKFHNDLPQEPATQRRYLTLTGCEGREPFFTVSKILLVDSIFITEYICVK